MRCGAVASRRSKQWSRSGPQHRRGAPAHGTRTHRRGGQHTGHAPTTGGHTTPRGGRRGAPHRGGHQHTGGSLPPANIYIGRAPGIIGACAYLVWLPARGNITATADVRFNDETFPWAVGAGKSHDSHPPSIVTANRLRLEALRAACRSRGHRQLASVC